MLVLFQQYKIDCRVTIELLDTEPDENEKCVSNAQTWSNYVERIVSPGTGANNTTNAVSSAAVNVNNNANNSEKVEIKEEKIDEVVVSGK